MTAETAVAGAAVGPSTRAMAGPSPDHEAWREHGLDPVDGAVPHPASGAAPGGRQAGEAVAASGAAPGGRQTGEAMAASGAGVQRDGGP
ncbi:MAG: hypothetical protein EA340_13345, partial [Nitriliruptor sp.]